MKRTIYLTIMFVFVIDIVNALTVGNYNMKMIRTTGIGKSLTLNLENVTLNNEPLVKGKTKSGNYSFSLGFLTSFSDVDNPKYGETSTNISAVRNTGIQPVRFSIVTSDTNPDTARLYYKDGDGNWKSKTTEMVNGISSVTVNLQMNDGFTYEWYWILTDIYDNSVTTTTSRYTWRYIPENIQPGGGWFPFYIFEDNITSNITISKNKTIQSKNLTLVTKERIIFPVETLKGVNTTIVSVTYEANQILKSCRVELEDTNCSVNNSFLIIYIKVKISKALETKNIPVIIESENGEMYKTTISLKIVNPGFSVGKIGIEGKVPKALEVFIVDTEEGKKVKVLPVVSGSAIVTFLINIGKGIVSKVKGGEEQ